MFFLKTCTNFRVICNRHSSFRWIFLCYSQIYCSVWNVKKCVNIQNTDTCSFLASSWFHRLKYAWCLWMSINSLLLPLLLYPYFVYTLSRIVKQSEQTRLLRNVLEFPCPFNHFVFLEREREREREKEFHILLHL